MRQMSPARLSSHSHCGAVSARVLCSLRLSHTSQQVIVCVCVCIKFLAFHLHTLSRRLALTETTRIKIYQPAKREWLALCVYFITLFIRGLSLFRLCWSKRAGSLARHYEKTKVDARAWIFILFFHLKNAFVTRKVKCIIMPSPTADCVMCESNALLRLPTFSLNSLSFVTESV